MWIGNSENEKCLEEYFEEHYDEDYHEDAVMNIFSLDFGFRTYDHDYSEYNYINPTDEVSEIIKGVLQLLPSTEKKFKKILGNKLNHKCNLGRVDTMVLTGNVNIRIVRG